MSLQQKWGLQELKELLQQADCQVPWPKQVSCQWKKRFLNSMKYKQNGKVVKGKHTGRPRKTSKHQDRKLGPICLENRKGITKK